MCVCGMLDVKSFSESETYGYVWINPSFSVYVLLFLSCSLFNLLMFIFIFYLFMYFMLVYGYWPRVIAQVKEGLGNIFLVWSI